ncbi:MAG: hypothetical protein K2L19_06200 [Eubacterium sp.]|nr:hypothetical protein [Eubacterium sp.]
MKKVISLFLSIMMLFSITASIDFFAYADDYIEIWNIEDLYMVRYNMDANYRLMADIDMTVDTAADGEFSYGGRGWEPIGSNGIYGSEEFTGKFDGNRHSIIGMNINVNSNLPAGTGSDVELGLFANNSGIISDLKMVDCNVYFYSYADKSLDCASIAANNMGIIINCSSSGIVKSDKGRGFVGGIAGYNGGTIECCYNIANVRGGYFVGGIAGRGNSNAQILNCYNVGEIINGTGIVEDLCSVNNSYSLSKGIGGTSKNCYYLAGTGAKSQSGAKELSESQMKKSYMYPGFDFENVWIIDPNSDYPYPQLRNNRQSVSAEVPPDEPSIDLENFKIKTVSLSLESSITMNYKVLKTAVVDFENPYIEFTRNDKITTVTDYTEQGDYYVFSYRDVAPQAMNDNVQAVLYATYNDVLYNSAPVDYSVSAYAYAMLDKCSSNQYARLRTLLVDLLNYGAAAQIYQNYKTDDLVNADLTDTQKSWASSQELNLTNVTDKACDIVDNPAVEWKSVGLQLNNSVAVRYKFAADNVDDIQLKVTCGKSEWLYGAENFVDNGDGTYTFVFNDLNADKMQKDIYITAMNGDSAVSNTMRYSVESYAKQIQDSMPNSNLRKLTDAMMRYGISASNYI